MVKKYGWIGFYSHAGMLEDESLLCREDERYLGLQIDPSFPELPPLSSLELPNWVVSIPREDRDWICNGSVDIPDELLYRQNINNCQGPWIAVSAYLDIKDKTIGRMAFGNITAVLVATQDVNRLVESFDKRTHMNMWRLEFYESPRDYYTFAGEIPWSPDFARIDPDRDIKSLYRVTVNTVGGVSNEIEALAHCYAWEGHHSHLNQAGGAPVPSKNFSEKFNLRGVAQTFDQTLPNGNLATITLNGPKGFDGHLLYLREDLLYRYAAGRQLIWFGWGERLLYTTNGKGADWLVESRQKGEGFWKYLREAKDLSNLFAG